MAPGFGRCFLPSLIGAALWCALIACGGPRHDIVGKWQMAGGADGVIWEFTSNGGATIGDTRGRYVFRDSERVKIEMPYGTSVYQIKVARDQMSLRDSTGANLQFTRVK